MRQAIEQVRRQLRIDEDARPLGKHQVGRDDHFGVLVQFRQQVKQERPASLGEGQIAQLVEDHEVVMGEATGLAPGLLLFQCVDQFEDGGGSRER
jgi:hypothetical protein